MDTRYQTILDQLHTNKRQLANYRQKYLNIQNDLLMGQQQIRSLKKINGNLKQQVQKLTEQNKFLIQQKQSIMNEYSTSVQSIKDEISKKQNQIYSLKQNAFSPFMNQKLIEKQLRCQIQKQFQQKLQLKQKRIQQLQSLNDKLNFDKQVQQQKYLIKVQSLQRQLKQMQNSHLIELQTYANKMYQNSQQNKISEEQILLRKLKRQIDQLRINLDHTQQQLNESVIEKNRIQKQYSNSITQFNKQKQAYFQQINLKNNQLKQSNYTTQNLKMEKDSSTIRQKQRQIKQLKDKLQDLRRQNIRKDKQLSQNQLQITQKQNQIKKIKQMNTKFQHQKINQLRIQKESLQREINQLKFSNQHVRRQNLDLMNDITEMQSQNIKSFKENNQTINKNKIYAQQTQVFSNIIRNKKVKNQQKQYNVKNKKFNINNSTQIVQNSILQQTYEANHNNKLDNSFGQVNRAKSPQNYKDQSLQNQKRFYEAKIQQQVLRNKQLGQKYVDLKKKYRNLQQKFKQANNKVVQLLKTKIQLGSPTAASRNTVQFVTSPNFKYSHSPEVVTGSMNQKFFHSVNHSQTQGRLGPMRHVVLSPQNNTTQMSMTSNQNRKGQRSTSSKGDQSFYERSIKVKNAHKFKQIKCLNHDGNHDGCSHSPFK